MLIPGNNKLIFSKLALVVNWWLCQAQTLTCLTEVMYKMLGLHPMIQNDVAWHQTGVGGWDTKLFAAVQTASSVPEL